MALLRVGTLCRLNSPLTAYTTPRSLIHACFGGKTFQDHGGTPAVIQSASVTQYTCIGPKLLKHEKPDGNTTVCSPGIVAWSSGGKYEWVKFRGLLWVSRLVRIIRNLIISGAFYLLICCNYELYYHPLHVKSMFGSVEDVKELVEAGHDPMKRASGYTLLISGALPAHCAAYLGRVDVLEYLLTVGGGAAAAKTEPLVVHKDYLSLFGGKTLLHCACVLGHVNTVKLLASKGVDMSAKDCNNMTALHYATWLGHTTAIRHLIKRGAKTTDTDAYGRTPLHIALRRITPWPLDMVTCLIEEGGAPLNVKDQYGKTPMDYIRRKWYFIPSERKRLQTYMCTL